MEFMLGVMSVVGLGVTVTLLSFRSRQNSPRWPPLHEASLDDKRREESHSKEDNDPAGTNLLFSTTDNSQLSYLECQQNLESHSAATDCSDASAVLAHQKSNMEKTRPRRVLFVIAHPDDECMFFGPSILHFTQKEKAMVFLICLTNGSYVSAVTGKKRQRELWNSCRLLGIPDSNITLYRCSHLPDHPSKTWPVVTTANIINRHLHALACDMVVTFDKSGVSGHINHRSLHSSLNYLVEEHLLPEHCHAFCLDSVNIVRKYTSVLDLPLSLLCSSYTITTGSRQRTVIRKAMRAHASQYEWFRKLYMIFSRYVVLNTLTRVTASTPRCEADSVSCNRSLGAGSAGRQLLAASIRRRNLLHRDHQGQDVPGLPLRQDEHNAPGLPLRQEDGQSASGLSLRQEVCDTDASREQSIGNRLLDSEMRSLPQSVPIQQKLANDGEITSNCNADHQLENCPSEGISHLVL